MQNLSNPLLAILTDAIASLAFSTIVTDAAGATVIHVDSADANQLVIAITNQTSSELTVAQLSGAPTSSNNNILFQMPNDQLYFYEAPSIDASSAPGTWALATDSSSRGSGWVDSIYLANTGTCKLNPKGQPGDTLKLVINYKRVVPDDPKALTIPVQVSYQNISNSAGTGLSGSTPPQTMSLMANAGRPSPLVGAFVGPQRVLNDGTTKQTLTLRMVNTSQDPLQFIVPSAGQPTQSYIEVRLPISDQAADAVWALCTPASWDLIQVSLAGNASTGWTAAKSATTPGAIKLSPDFATVNNIPSGGVIELLVSDLVSGLTPGMVQAQVSLNRFALIGTQTFGATLEKSPLIYNSGLGTGMILSAGTLGANTALNISGDSSGALTQITQSGTGPALALTGDANISAAISADTASINQSLRINGPASASQNPSLSLGGHGDFNIDAPGTTAGRFTVQDSSGYVGINNAAPSTQLDVNGGANISGNLTAGSATISGALTSTSFTSNAANINGGLTAGGTTINGPLTVNTTSGYFTLNSTTGFGANICNAPDYSQGTVSIGGTGYSNYMLTITNNQSTGMGVWIDAPNLSGSWWAVGVKGQCINSSGSWSRISDIRLKEKIQSFDDGLGKILQIEPIKYYHKEEADLGKEEHIGVSAQDLEKIAPYMIGKARLKPDSEEEYLAINPGPLTYMLVNAVKELHTEIETLKTQKENQEKGKPKSLWQRIWSGIFGT